MRFEVQNKLVGVQAIMLTPFLENEDVDFDGLEKNIDFVIREGARFITTTGNCGEFSALTVPELEDVIRVSCRIAKEHGAAAVPGVGSASLRTLIQLCNTAEREGADAVLIPPPFHGAPSFKQLKAFFEELSKHTSIKMQFYYYPDLHRVQLSALELAELLHMPCFAAVKETANLIPTHAMLRDLVGDDVNIITGTGEFQAPDFVLTGEDGFISTMINYSAKLPLKLWNACAAGDVQRAAAMRRAMAPLFIEMQKGFSIATMKALCEARGLAGGPVRLPLLNSPRDPERINTLLRVIESVEANPIFA